MKRHGFIRELVDKGRYLIRHGKKHDIYQNHKNGRKAPIPRHTEIRNTLCMLIRKQLVVE
ncbi:MAG: addiction module toxin, HicA family [Planctomycetota bacterium]